MRKFFIVSYDISSDKIRNQVFKTLMNYGERIQYSVFCCRLNMQEKEDLKKKLNKLISKEQTAQIMFIAAGNIEEYESQPKAEWLGKQWQSKITTNVF